MKRNKLLLLLMIVCILTSCGNRQSISTYELIENAKKEDEIIREKNKLLMKDLLDRQYANQLYLEDFQVVNDELMPSFIKGFEKKYFSDLGYPYFFKSDIQFFNDSLEKVKEGHLTIKEVLTSPEKHLRKTIIELYTFIPMEDRQADSLLAFDEKMIQLSEVYKENQVDYEIVWRVYDEQSLENIGFEEVKNLEKPLVPLEQTGLLLNNSLYSNNNIFGYEKKGTPYGVWMSDEIRNLREKFNKEFIFTGFDSKEDFAAMFAPVDDLSIEFELISDSDAYLTLLAQKKLSDEVYRIIEEEGAREYIGAFVIGNDFERREFTWKSFDMSEDVDNITFLNDVFLYEYDVSLIYLTVNEEDIDYSVLKNISTKISHLLSRYYEHNKKMRSPINLFVDFYILENDSSINLATKLLYENRLTDRWLGYSRGLAYLYADMYIRRSETEGFHFLDVYGEKINFILDIPIDPSDYSVEEFSKQFRSYSEF